MPQIIELPDELAEVLADEATRLGLSLPVYALHLLASGRPSMGGIHNGRELVDYWRSEGLIGSRPDIVDSQVQARYLRERAQRRGT